MPKSANRSGTRRSAIAGFSMVELAVSLTVLLILTAIAIPSLMRSFRTYQLNDAAARVSDMLKFTRFEAVRQNKKVSFLLVSTASGWVVWTGPSTDTAPSPVEKQTLIASFATVLTSGFPPGPTIVGSGTLNVLSGSSCTPGCFAFDARGAVSPLQAYVLYLGSTSDPEFGYRAVVLLPSGSTQIWSAPNGGSWQQIS